MAHLKITVENEDDKNEITLVFHTNPKQFKSSKDFVGFIDRGLAREKRIV